MNRYMPNYYQSFACIQGRCRHNCCIGWEIDIDQESYDRYRGIKGEFGTRLKEAIKMEEGTPVFQLTEEERCPFLNEDYLCDMILELGEDALCEICTAHPRFVNFFSDREEWGLGLCCEAAAELIIKQKEPVTFLEESDTEVEWQEGEETVFFSLREEIYDEIQDRTKHVSVRIREIAERWEVFLPDWEPCQWGKFLEGLERLDTAWEKQLDTLKGLHTFESKVWSEEWELAWEQLLLYFVYRHLSESIYDGRFRERLGFCLLSVLILQGLCQPEDSLDTLVELARQYSAEIEYSDENMEAILGRLH